MCDEPDCGILRSSKRWQKGAKDQGAKDQGAKDRGDHDEAQFAFPFRLPLSDVDIRIPFPRDQTDAGKFGLAIARITTTT